MLILTGNQVDKMTDTERWQRFHELELLLNECTDMPPDHPLKKEYAYLKHLIEFGSTTS